MSALLQQPALGIRCAGAPLPLQVAGAVAEVCVRQALSLPAMAEITLRGAAADPDEWADFFTPGTPIEISVAGRVLFGGAVLALEFAQGPDSVPEFRVTAADALQQLRQRQQVRAFVDADASAVACELTADLGLTVSGESGPRWPRLIQHRQTDFEILAQTAARAGLVFTLRGSVLHFLTPAGDGPEIALRPGRELRGFRVSTSPHEVWSRVSTSAWNPAGICAVTGEAGASGGSGERHLVTRAVPSEDHASALARAELTLRHAGKVRLSATAEGCPDLIPGCRVALENAGFTWRGPHAVTVAEHRITPHGGYVTVLETAPDEPAQDSGGTLTLPGVVSAINDPESLCRVKVTFASLEDMESDWMPVVMPALGRDKGLVALPDEGDRVLVLCPGGDPSLGIVLGGMADPQHPPKYGTGGGKADACHFHTARGQSLMLDAAHRQLVLESEGGGKLEIKRGGVHLHSRGDLLIDAPGSTITIRAKAVRFEEA